MIIRYELYFPFFFFLKWSEEHGKKMVCLSVSHTQHAMLSNGFWSWWAWSSVCVRMFACIMFVTYYLLLIRECCEHIGCFGMLSDAFNFSHTETVSACFVSMALTIYRFLNQFSVLICIRVYTNTYIRHTLTLAYTQRNK